MPVLQKRASRPKRISLVTLLTGLVSLSVILTVTILLLSFYQSKKQALINTTLTLNHTSAIKMSHTLDALIKSMRSSLQYSASIFSNRNEMTADEVYSKLELIRRTNNYFNSVTVVDETGRVQSVSPGSIGTVGNYVKTETAKMALALKKPYISKPYVTSSTKRLIVLMSEPIFDKDGIYRGVIGGTIYLHEDNILNTIFGSNPTDELGSSFYIVGSDGHLLFHRDSNRIGEDISANPAVRKLIQGKSGYEQMVNLRGQTVLAAYVKVPENDWGVVVVSPISVVQEQVNRDIQSVLLYMLPSFLLLMLVVIVLARKIAKPFVSLANLVSKAGRQEVELSEGSQHWNREAELLSRAIRFALTNIKKKTEQLTHDARTDPLTGLTNRRTLEETMQKWMAEQIPFSIMMMDLDRFKAINDTYGHQAGDEVLRHFAKIISSSLRPEDVSCRFGGEEFVVLVSHTGLEEAYQVAERIRRALETRTNPIGQRLTVSQGIAHYPSHAVSPEGLLHVADEAMYKAKRAGRNQTMIAEEE
ncbi:sensor domain-containing diguanylate cyclase [Brevibacillus brevis]|uniref:sensor domain-containing diguanylate cyclase n=1 Tax=Brevibacillus brevis TaxID=1393 RepID=UPI001157A73B|nr:sensor domain-containing diguanylate cyclase [Lysinibacillus sp. SDF0063]TQR32098.1 GGDEF domain-containing protein [Lysinibacillus sp. SDF0063]